MYFQFSIKCLEDLYKMLCFQYFLNDDPISPKQSDFEPGDSCIYQLISINHKIYKGINEGLKMRGVSVS